MTRIALSSDVHAVPAAETLPLAHVLDTRTLGALLTRHIRNPHVHVKSCSITHIRYRPQKSCIVSYEVGYTAHGEASEQTARLYARCDHLRGHERTVERSRQLTISGESLLGTPIVMQDASAVLFEYPADARLPGLALLNDNRALADLLARHEERAGPAPPSDGQGLHREVLRYKPESRCVVRVGWGHDGVFSPSAAAPGVVLRHSIPEKATRSFLYAQHIHRQLGSHTEAAVPLPVLCVEVLGIEGFSWVPGDKFTDRLKTDAGPCSAGAGRALAFLHGLELSDLPAQEPSEMVDKMRASVEAWRAIDADCVPNAERIAEHLAQMRDRLGSEHRGTVHGDFHPGQIVYGDGRYWLLDLGGVCRSEPERDLGKYTAQLLLWEERGHLPDARSLQKFFLDGYGQVSRYVPDAEKLSFWTALELVELAAKQFRRLKPHWPQATARLLALAEREIAGDSPA
jgi:aminoglycoside phosphotransferase (APT) family kinase protein